MWMSVWGPGRGPTDQKALEQSKTGRQQQGPKRSRADAGCRHVDNAEGWAWGEIDPNTTSPRHWNGLHLYTLPSLEKMKKNIKKGHICLQPLCSLLLPSAWALMEDCCGTVSIHTWHKRSTTVFNTAIRHTHSPPHPQHTQIERSPLRTFHFLWTCAISKAKTHPSIAAEGRRVLFCVAGRVSARLGLHFSSQRALSVFISSRFCCVVSWVKQWR